jgi:predicted ATPase/DNA-binding XRE family transcriptional regulator
MAETTFGELLRQYRRAAGYSQEGLAERAGLSVGAIAALEQGIRRAPHRDTVDAISDALGMPELTRREFEAVAAQARRRQRHDDSVLPASLTSFIERREIYELQNLLAAHRLLTITGSGGVGKTRIAIEVARRVEHLYDETWFVDLLPLRGGNLVRSQIAARLNVQLRGDDGLTEIAHRLRSRRVLLVIDNCEHVVVEAASVIEKLLGRSTTLTVMATSREALAVPGELAYRLPSMDAKTASDLFVERAREADPRWQPDAERLALVGEICKELDGIPLAIEITASRVSTLGLDALRTRLRGGIGFTRGGDAADRHQTMGATIAWSYDMLSQVEKTLFRRLSVFMGGFTLGAAQNICSDKPLSADLVADALSQSVRKSLINADHAGTSIRYRFLEPIRTFAWDRLRESGELESTMGRFIEWLKKKAAILDADPPPHMLADERIELGNVRFAVRWAESMIDHPAAVVSAADVLIGFRNVWFGVGRELEFRTLAFGLLEQVNESDHPEVVGRLIHAVAGFLNGSELLTLSERAIPLLVASGHRARAADLHARCASAECMRGDAASAERHLTEGEALLDDASRRTRTGFSFASHGAYVHSMLKNFRGARALLDRLEVPAGEPFEVDLQVLFALIESGQGRVENAIDILNNAKPGLERHSNAKHLAILVCGNLAVCYMSSGNARAAEDELREALEAAVDIRDLWLTTGIADLGRYAAFFAATSGRVDLAARLVGACDQLRNPATLEDDVTSRELAIKAIHERLSPERAAALGRSGAAEDLYELLEEYLAQPAADDSARPSATSSPRATSVMRSSPN